MRPIDDPGQPPSKPHSLTCRSHEPNGFCTCSVGILARARPVPQQWSEPRVSSDLVRDGVHYLKARFLGYKVPPVELPADSVIEDVVRYILGLDVQDFP